MSDSLKAYYRAAAEAGVSPLDFWSMTPAEIAEAVRAFSVRREALRADLRRLAWQCGRLTGIAVKNPLRYPAWSEFSPATQAVGDMEKYCAALALALGGRVGKGGSAVR